MTLYVFFKSIDKKWEEDDWEGGMTTGKTESIYGNEGGEGTWSSKVSFYEDYEESSGYDWGYPEQCRVISLLFNEYQAE